MKSFYSLIKISTNSLSDENLTIGIMLSDKNNYLVRFSNVRQAIAKSLRYCDSKLIDFLVTEIENKINGTNQFKLNYYYFEDLSYYSNGILKFTNPTRTSLETTEKNLAKLFSLLVEPKLEKASEYFFNHHFTV